MNFSFLQNYYDAPSDTTSEEVPGRAAESKRDQYPEQATPRGPDMVKRMLSEVQPRQRVGVSAYLSLWRQVERTAGGKSIMAAEPVEIEGKPLKEYRFFVRRADLTKADRFNVRSTFGDGPEVAMSFGEKPKIWNFSGVMRKGPGSNNWWQAMEEFYRTRLRASLLMRRNEFVRFRMGKMSMRGYLLNFNTRKQDQMDDVKANFQFSMFVRSYRFVDGYTYEPASQKLAADRPAGDIVSSATTDPGETIPEARGEEEGGPSFA